jgi:hypothetical protein
MSGPPGKGSRLFTPFLGVLALPGLCHATVFPEQLPVYVVVDLYVLILTHGDFSRVASG